MDEATQFINIKDELITKQVPDNGKKRELLEHLSVCLSTFSIGRHSFAPEAQPVGVVDRAESVAYNVQ